MSNQKFEKSYFDLNYPDYFRQNPPYKEMRIISSIKKHCPKGSLLDVGCALGAFLSEAEKTGYSVGGCDISKFAVKYASKKFKVKQCSINTLKYPDSNFDVITVLDVIEHVPDINKAFSELSRVAKKSGIICFTMPVYDGLSGKIVNLIDKDPTHVNKFSRHKWVELLGKRFEVLEWQGILRYFFMKKHYLHLQTRVFRNSCPAILVICRNKKR